MGKANTYNLTEQSAMARVLLVDDHAVVRAGYRQFLEADPMLEVSEASSGNETLDLLRQGPWALLIMDIHMPDRSGIDVLKHVIAGYPGLPVLMMRMTYRRFRTF